MPMWCVASGFVSFFPSLEGFKLLLFAVEAF